jgi:hypothetical protein
MAVHLANVCLMSSAQKGIRVLCSQNANSGDRLTARTYKYSGKSEEIASMIRLDDPYILAYQCPRAARSPCPRASPDTRWSMSI